MKKKAKTVPSKTGSATKKSSKFTKSNYRRVGDSVVMRRITFDLPETLLHRMSVYAAQHRTNKVTVLRDLLDKHIPTLEALLPTDPRNEQPAPPTEF